MNTYTARFFAECPTNGMRVYYVLRIESETPIRVETILGKLPEHGFHEDIADALKALGGKQTLTADHHSVTIETTR